MLFTTRSYHPQMLHIRVDVCLFYVWVIRLMRREQKKREERKGSNENLAIVPSIGVRCAQMDFSSVHKNIV